MAIQTKIAQEDQSVYDLIVQSYGSMEFTIQFFSDNKTQLTDGFETDMKGLTFSYDDTLGSIISIGVKSREEGVDLGSQPVLIDSISMSTFEVYSGYTISTTTVDNPFGLQLLYEIFPATASNPGVNFNIINNYICNFIESTSNISGYHDGNTNFFIEAQDIGQQFTVKLIIVENMRDYDEVIFEIEQPNLPGSLSVFDYGLFHSMQDNSGTYFYNTGSNSDIWIADGVNPLPTSIFTPGIMSLGHQPLFEVSGASYSQVPLLSVTASTDQLLHCSYRNTEGTLKFGIGNYIDFNHTTIGSQSTMDITVPSTGETIQFIVEDDVKFLQNKWVSVDLIINPQDSLIRLIVNGKDTVVQGGSTYSVDGTWPFTYGSASVSGDFFITNFNSSGYQSDILVDDVFYLDLNSGGNTILDYPVDYSREYLDIKHPQL